MVKLHGNVMQPHLLLKSLGESVMASMCRFVCVSTSGEAEYLTMYKVCFLSFAPRPITAATLCIIFAACDSLMVEMKSRKCSFGKRGFSRPLKYSLSTPATELISCSFWSSVRGSSPEEKTTSALQKTPPPPPPQRYENVVSPQNQDCSGI